MSPPARTYAQQTRTEWFGGQPLPTGKRVRADALPEYTRYRDDGCEVHPTCLTCPLSRCRYDQPGGLRALLNVDRDREIVARRLGGATVDDLALRFGVSRRTVFRVLETGPQDGRAAANPSEGTTVRS